MSLSIGPSVALSALLGDVRSGFACGEDLDEGVLQFRMNNVDREGQVDFSAQRRVSPSMVSKDLLLNPGDILFNSTNSPDLVGKTALFRGRHEPVTFSNHFLRLVVRPRLADPSYLAHFLKWSFSRGSFRTMSRQWVNQASVNKDQLLSMPVPAPILAEQRRIAAILDQAEALRAKRRQALAKLDTLTQSLFLEMFGNPVLNKMGWEKKTAIDYAECIVPGRDKPKSFTGATPWVTTADLQHLGYTEQSRHQLGLSDKEISEVRAKVVPKASVLLTCVGDLGVVSISKSDMVVNQQLHSFQMSDEMSEEFFMHALAFQKDYMYRNASQTTLPYMNKTVCNETPMIRPPKELQMRFAEAVRGIDRTRYQYKESLKGNGTLMAALTRATFEDYLSHSSKVSRGGF